MSLLLNKVDQAKQEYDTTKLEYQERKESNRSRALEREEKNKDKIKIHRDRVLAALEALPPRDLSTCIGLTLAGNSCSKKPSKGYDFCYLHIPK